MHNTLHALYVQGVLEKMCLFPYQCNTSLAYIYRCKWSLFLAGQLLKDQVVQCWRGKASKIWQFHEKIQFFLNTLYNHFNLFIIYFFSLPPELGHHCKMPKKSITFFLLFNLQDVLSHFRAELNRHNRNLEQLLQQPKQNR